MDKTGPIRVVHIGLGPIGQGIVREIASRPGVELVGAVDVDPTLAGRDAGEICGLPEPAGVKVVATLDEVEADADLACVTTSSSVAVVEPTLTACCAHGLAVVSTCEELSYPWRTAPAIAARIDDAARRAGVAVIATGVNPGFVMDLLPIVSTGVCSRVDAIRVERYQDASRRRLPFQNKVGAGLSRAEFEEKARAGEIRHVGLTESMHMIAARMGWNLEETSDEIAPACNKNEVRGVHQVGRAWCDRRMVIELVFHAELGLTDPADRVVVSGEPGFELLVPGGFHGDVATCAIAVNCMPLLRTARPGLRTMVDMDPVSCFR